MGLWKKGFDRSRTGENRREEVLTPQIEEFFNNREKQVSYEIVDDKNWIVDVNGNFHLYQSDLDEGKLFFKIGKLAGNLYFHGKHLSPSVIPIEMDGEIVFVPDEGELVRNKGQKETNEDEDNLNLGLLSTKSREQVVKQLETALTESLANGYDIDVQEILSRLSEEWANRSNYELRVVISEIKHGTSTSDKLECDFYVTPDGKPLKLSAIEKATYLLFILHKEGLDINLKPRQIALWKRIYNKIAGSVQDMENGIMNMKAENYKDTTLNGYRSHIRKEIQKQISNGKIVDEFAIEGYKDEPFKVLKSTDEMRAEIREKFGLD